jgi:hypothetical protein
MHDLWSQILQSSQQTPLQFQVTGFSQSPHGYILAFLFGPGLVSISPANMMTMSRMLVVFIAFDGKHSGLEPKLCILVIKMLCVSCWCSHVFRFKLFWWPVM